MDRVVANDGWCALFPKVDVLMEGALSLDHLPIIVTLHDVNNMGISSQKFKHKACWVLDGTFTELINRAWRAKDVRVKSWNGLRSKLGSC